MVQDAGNGYLRQANGYLVVDAGLSNNALAADIFRAFAVHCLEKQLNRALIRIADSDPARERALRDAVATMLLAGMPSGFRIALLAGAPGLRARYRNAERDFSLVGVAAKIFDGEAEAVGWLEA